MDLFDLGTTSSTLDPITVTSLMEIDEVLCERVLVDTELTPKPLAPGSIPQSSFFREDGLARFSIRMASNEGHRNDASFLVRKMYGWRGYDTEPATSHPNCITLIASMGDKALATITVGFDSDVGLAVGNLYPEQVERLRADGAHICEFTRLAVDRNKHSKELLAMLFHVAYMYARRMNGKTDLLIEVNPRHVRFYNRMLGFRTLGPERICPRVNAPAILMWLPLQYAEEQIELHGGQREDSVGNRSLYPLFFSPVEEIGITARLRAAG